MGRRRMSKLSWKMRKRMREQRGRQVDASTVPTLSMSFRSPSPKQKSFRATLEKLTHFVRESEERQFPWEQLLSYRKSAARCFSFKNMECNKKFVSKEHIVVSKSVPEVCLPAAKKVPLLFFF